MYRYILETTTTAAARSRRQKTQCPACHSNSFVMYIDTLNNNDYVSFGVGRCDKENNCGYHKRPEANKNTNYIKTAATNDLKLIKQLNSLTVQDFENTRNDFTNVDLLEYFKNKFGVAMVEHCIQRYMLGNSNHKFTEKDSSNHVVFWYLNEHKQPLNAKIMAYDINSGSRQKQPLNCVTWLHYLLKKDKQPPSLFGLHLLSDRLPNTALKVIVIVESEKTALICSYYFPEFTWLATGGKNNLKIEMLKNLKHRKVLLIPDTDSVELWRDLVSKNNLFIKFQILNLSKIFGCSGVDFADLLTDKICINTNKQPQSFQDFAAALTNTINKDNLTMNQKNVITMFYKIIPQILNNFKKVLL